MKDRLFHLRERIRARLKPPARATSPNVEQNEASYEAREGRAAETRGCRA
jgi:hypothetical protein